MDTISESSGAGPAAVDCAGPRAVRLTDAELEEKEQCRREMSVEIDKLTTARALLQRKLREQCPPVSVPRPRKRAFDNYC